LVSGPVALAAPSGVRLIEVESAADMQRALEAEFDRATVLVMAAAVADYRPASPLGRKLKKGAAALQLALARNADIVSGLAKGRNGRTVVGFAAETHDVVREARRKLREKGLDLVVANDVTANGAGFGSDTNVVRLIDANGLDRSLPVLPKDEVAARILDWVAARRRGIATRRSSRAHGSRRRSRRALRPSA
jgi:phosphopantothenoylcysteine decarboxylase/phosphopantothenate--cysteine ligase